MAETNKKYGHFFHWVWVPFIVPLLIWGIQAWITSGSHSQPNSKDSPGDNAVQKAQQSPSGPTQSVQGGRQKSDEQIADHKSIVGDE